MNENARLADAEREKILMKILMLLRERNSNGFGSARGCYMEVALYLPAWQLSHAVLTPAYLPASVYLLGWRGKAKLERQAWIRRVLFIVPRYVKSPTEQYIRVRGGNDGSNDSSARSCAGNGCAARRRANKTRETRRA